MNRIFLKFIPRLLPVLMFLTSYGLVQGQDKGPNLPGSPTNHQTHPQTPTGPGGQPSSSGSIGCCCCCPTQTAVTFSAIGLPLFILPTYPGCDHMVLTDPVVVSSGKLYVPYTDVEIPGPGRFNHVNLNFTRSYNSRDNFDGVLGWGWVTNLDISLNFSGSAAAFQDADGSLYFMQPNSSITFADGHHGGFLHGCFRRTDCAK